MAHFAELDDKNRVLRVVVISNESCHDAHGVEKEAIGEFFCKSLFGPETIWKQTSYHGHIRKNFAGVGYTFDPSIDAFVPPQPFNSWVLNTDTARWEAPVPMPNDGKLYEWDEASKSWKVLISTNTKVSEKKTRNA